MELIRLDVYPLSNFRTEGGLIQEAERVGHVKIMDMLKVASFWIYSTELKELALDKQSFHAILNEVFVDPVIQKAHVLELSTIDMAPLPENFKHTSTAFALEVAFRPGVKDNLGDSATEALQLALEKRGNLPKAIAETFKVSSGMRYLCLTHHPQELLSWGSVMLANNLLHKVHFGPLEDTLHREGIEKIFEERKNEFQLNTLNTKKIPLAGPMSCAYEDLTRMNSENCWALSGEEIQTISKAFQTQGQAEREKRKLPVYPTLMEMEVIAQTWSEHCKHKIFNAQIDYSESIPSGQLRSLGKRQIQSLYKECIKGATKKIIEDRNLNWVESAFVDNAGIVSWGSHLNFCIKVETHNSPSALDPYGGSLTGILGVNRDILGTGMGSRPIANMDVFCFGEIPCGAEDKLRSLGAKSPYQILHGVHKGIEDGGNKSGIPTINGSITFDPSFSGKPLVYCGTVGAMPKSEKGVKKISEGDRILMIGGAVGKDGIHGATFSSLELSEESPLGVVQIGDPLTQKRVGDFLEKARELHLYSFITDNGAGGLSSSVGEMAHVAGGARLDLTHVPLKYRGLTPEEIMISESQERMSLAVPPAKLNEFLALAEIYGVMATDVGSFNHSGYLEVVFEGQVYAYLNLDFLHDGYPKLKVKAHFEPTWLEKGLIPQRGQMWEKFEVPGPYQSSELMSTLPGLLLKILGRPNVRSKESLVRQYDHEVQAATTIKPFVGKTGVGPSDAGALALYPHHPGSQNEGLALGHGLCPRISLYDAYLMAALSLDEAVRNTLALGANPEKMALLDNFCWPDPLLSPENPDAPKKAAALARACVGLYETAVTYGMPFVSGKDSMKNDFKGTLRNEDGSTEKIKISVLPTLLVTALGFIEDIQKTQTSDFKNAGDLIYLVKSGGPGSTVKYLKTLSAGLGGSELGECLDLGAFPQELRMPPVIHPEANRRLYTHIYRAIERGLFESIHDISEGGLMTALCESMIGGQLGAKMKVQGSESVLSTLFHEGPGQFVVSVKKSHQESFEQHFSSVCELNLIGEVQAKYELQLTLPEGSLTWGGLELENAWRKTGEGW